MSENLSKKILVLCNQSRILYLTRFELIKTLLDRGDTVLISAPKSPYSAPFEEAGCRMVDTPLDRRGLTPWSDFKLRGEHALAHGDAVQPRQDDEHLPLHVGVFHFLPPMVADSAAFSMMSILPWTAPSSRMNGSSR